MAIVVLVVRENDTEKNAAPIVHSKMDFSL
jgi:hypothetical protein